MSSEFIFNHNDLLDNKSFSIKLKKKPEIDLKLNVKFKKKRLSPNFQKDLYNLTKKYKTFIEYTQQKYKLNWNKLKMFTNNFELLTYNNSKKNIQSLVNYIPISRAYFKFIEIIETFQLIDNTNSSFRYAALAEGPGGFVEAFINYRKKKFLGISDKIFCITLKSHDSNIPNWNKIKRLMKHKQKNIYLCYGKDYTGNLYKLDNILYYKKYVNEKVDLVSGDGGFDYSNNFDDQEQMTFHLIFCEIVTAFSVLKKNGSFILKIFDIFTTITLEYLYLLNMYFDEIIITKPNTSRPANSEKYIVCKGFKEINQDNLNKLYTIVDKWDNNHRYISKIFNLQIPDYYINCIEKYNYTFTKKQIEAILKVLICRNYKKPEIDILIQTQIIYCIYWCLRYNQPINYRSNFFKAFKS